MGAPKGNKFWQLADKFGREKRFRTPEELWSVACEYFEWCDNHSIEVLDYKGKDACPVVLPKMRAYTWAGIQVYAGVSSFEHYKKDPTYKEYFEVIKKIESVMYEQKFTGAASGVLNPNIIARDLALVERVESKNENTNYNVTVTSEEAQAIKNKLLGKI